MSELTTREVLGLLRYDRLALAGGGAALLAETATALAGPWLAGRFTAGLLATDAQAPAVMPPHFILLLWLGILCLRILARYLHQQTLGRATIRMIAELRTRLFEHLQFLPVYYFQNKPRGEILSALTRDTTIIGHFITGSLLPLLPQALIFGGAVVFMLYLEPLVGALAAIMIPAFVVANRLLARRLRPAAAALTRSHARYQGMLEQNLSMIPAIKAFNREGIELDASQMNNAALQASESAYLKHENRLTAGIELLGAVAIILLLWLGMWAIGAGRLAPEDLVSLAFYGLLMIRPVTALGGAWGRLQQAKGSSGYILEILRQAPEPASTDKPPLAPFGQQIRFDAVSYAYPGHGPLLEGLELVIGRGEKIALVGPNGAGKTTLVHLLMRFADPDRGRILFDGADIREHALHSLRAQIGLVDQTLLLANDTVAHNIAYGIADPDVSDIEKAARDAQAWSFITQLPRQLETVIGPQGVKLSGGQRQRLALARALLKKPRILILDEATSMQDPIGEQHLISHIQDRLPDITVIIISHRPATLAFADRVYELKDGTLSLVEEATTHTQSRIDD